MKKSFLVVALGLVALTSACVTGGNSKRAGYDSDACRMKCQRLGQHVAVNASSDAGKCICMNDSSSTR